MIIRQAASAAEADLAYAVEEQCYVPEAAATRDAFHKRLQTFGNYFWIAEEESGRIAGVANGVRLSHERLDDEGMKQMEGYDPEGPFFCLLTVAVAPEYRSQGVGQNLVRAVIHQARLDKLQAILLMCEEHLIPFYQQLGFRYVKPSLSLHGGIEWHEMKLTLA